MAGDPSSPRAASPLRCVDEALPRRLNKSPAPLASWEQEKLGCVVVPPDKSLPRLLVRQKEPARMQDNSLPRVRTPKLGQQQCDRWRIRAEAPAGACGGGLRKVSWDDFRRGLFGYKPEGEERKVRGDGSDSACSICEDVHSASPAWQRKVEPDELALTHLFETAGSSSQDEGRATECEGSVCSSSGGWKADFSSHFKVPSRSVTPPLSRIRAATPPAVQNRSASSSPRTATPQARSPVKPASTSPQKRFGAAPASPSTRRMRSATPLSEGESKKKSTTPEGPVLRTAEHVCPEHRFMQCSCCSRKDGSHLSVQIGVERELRVEGPRKAYTTSAVIGPPQKKPPMRFSLAPQKSAECLAKAAALRKSKARYTVLPVVTLSKNGKQIPAWQGRKCNSRVNPGYKGGWMRECSSVLPRTDSSQDEQPGTPELMLATPQLNSTARLLEKLQETKQERFDPRSAADDGRIWRIGDAQTNDRSAADDGRIWRIGDAQTNDRSAADDGRIWRIGDAQTNENMPVFKNDAGELAQRYKDLCKITERPSSSSDRERVPRKQKTEMMVSLRRNKPSISDLWVASEQCPQVCSTAPIRIEPSEWLHTDEAHRGNADAEREALCRGARNAMALYGLPNPF